MRDEQFEPPHQIDYAAASPPTTSDDMSRGTRIFVAAVILGMGILVSPLPFVISLFAALWGSIYLQIMTPFAALGLDASTALNAYSRRISGGELHPMANGLFAVLTFSQMPLYALIIAVTFYRKRTKLGFAIVGLVHVVAFAVLLVADRYLSSL